MVRATVEAAHSDFYLYDGNLYMCNSSHTFLIVTDFLTLGIGQQCLRIFNTIDPGWVLYVVLPIQINLSPLFFIKKLLLLS